MIPRVALFVLISCLSINIGSAFAEVRRALVIGVTDYARYSDNPIKFAHIDALRFAGFLEGDRAGRVKVTQLTNGDATRDAIWDAVESLKGEQPRPDTLFVFFSGHAEFDSDTQQLYLMPTGGDRKRLSATGISAIEFITRLRAVGPANLLIFLDACHSGAAILGKGGADSGDSVSGSLNGFITNLNKGNEGGTAVFVSATADEQSWEDEDNGQGIFTRFLIKGLEGDADGVGGQKDGNISAGELYNFLVREVPNRARALSKPAQHPAVSPDFKSAYIIAVAPSSPPVTSGAARGMKSPNIAQLRAVDPELALMVHAAFLKITSPSANWGDDSKGLLSSFEEARALRVGALPQSVKSESLINPVISPDGSLLVSCVDPFSLVAVSLNSEKYLSTLPIQFPDGFRTRRLILDSCEISISRDGQYIVVRVHTVDGRSWLSLSGLRNLPVPSLARTDYESGVFVGNTLLLSRSGTVTAMSAGTWAMQLSKDLGRPIRSLVADSESSNFAALREGGNTIYRLDEHTWSIGPGADGFSPSSICHPTGDALYCVSTNGWAVHALAGGGSSGGFGCNLGSPRGFPSTSAQDQGGWNLLFQCSAEPEILRLVHGIFPTSQPVRIPELVAAARLLRNGSVIVVGQRGGIYAFDSLKYGDCCSLAAPNVDARGRLSIGRNGMVAVLERTGDVGELMIFRERNLIKRIILRDVNWVERIAWSDSNKIIILSGESRLRLSEFVGSDYQAIADKDFNCGMPAAVDQSDSRLVCVAPDSQKLQIRSAANGKIERELDQHAGPVQDVFINRSSITAAGAYAGRNQTLVTVWNTSDGKLVSQRRCPVSGTHPAKPFVLLRSGNYFIQLDTPGQLFTRESLTCESGKPLGVTASSRILKGSPTADGIVFLDESMHGFHVVNPWERSDLYWDLELPIEDIAISPDGADVVAIVAGRVLRIPVTKLGFSALVKQRVRRELSAQECEDFFPLGNCPQLKR